jgi:hypothetical protein
MVYLYDKKRQTWPLESIHIVLDENLHQTEPIFLEYDTNLPSVRHDRVSAAGTYRSSEAEDGVPSIISPKVSAVSSRLKNLEFEIDTFTRMNEEARKEVDDMEDS